MFPGLPVRVWLLIAICAVACAPAMYTYRYIKHSPRGRDITQPPEDLSWRNPQRLAISLAALVGLAALAIFIYTPTAATFAQSPNFWPTLLGALGLWITYLTVKGLVTGSVEPMSRGSLGPYSRASQPIRYWLSIVWNGTMSGFMIWVTFTGTLDANRTRATEEATNRCLDSKLQYSPQEELHGCDTLIHQPENSREYELADLLAWRGYANERAGDYQHAIADYGGAIAENPKDAYSYLHRGMLRARTGDINQAIGDYTEVIRLDPKDATGYYYRAFANGHIGNFQRAISDFTDALRLKPDNAQAYYFRAFAYKESGNEERAAADLATASRLDPKLVNAINEIQRPQMASQLPRP